MGFQSCLQARTYERWEHFSLNGVLHERRNEETGFENAWKNLKFESNLYIPPFI